MTQDYKNLLLKDLCGRLPYVTMCTTTDNDGSLPNIWKIVKADMINEDFFLIHDSHEAYRTVDVKEVKPYLFPLKTMTIEQRNEFYEMTKPHRIASFKEEKLIREEGEYRPITPVMMYLNMIETDWLFKRHFDVFGLIEKGLAIDATDKNIY